MPVYIQGQTMSRVPCPPSAHIERCVRDIALQHDQSGSPTWGLGSLASRRTVTITRDQHSSRHRIASFGGVAAPCTNRVATQRCQAIRRPRCVSPPPDRPWSPRPRFARASPGVVGMCAVHVRIRLTRIPIDACIRPLTSAIVQLDRLGSFLAELARRHRPQCLRDLC